MLALRHRTLILLSLGIVSAAALFFGPDDVFGVDLGLVGSTVFCGVLVLFLVHLGRHSEAVFPADASPAERQGWVALVFLALIAIHFGNFLSELPPVDTLRDSALYPASRSFARNVGTFIVAWIVAASIVRAQNGGGVELDERDLRIQRAAQRLAGGVFSALIVAAIIVLAVFPEALRPWLRPLFVANALIGLLIAGSLAEHILLVVRYRRGRN